MDLPSGAEQNSSGRQRLYFIDTIRGITIVSMICFHFAWDLVYLFGIPIPWLEKTPGYLWQQSICWSFILISGFCWSFCRKPLKRGIIVFLCGALITFITVTFLPEDRIVYGVLTFLGSAMILLAILKPVLERIPALPGVLVSFTVFIWIKKINWHRIGWGSLSMHLGDFLYKNLLTTYLGFPQPGFFSTDFFAVLPWIFLYLTGYFLYRLYDKRRTDDKNSFPFLYWQEPCFSFLGKRSLWIYMIHQPVLYGIYLIWSAFLGG